MADIPQHPKTIKELIFAYWRQATGIFATFCAIGAIAYFIVRNEFTTATTIINGEVATSVFSAYGQFGDAIGGILNPVFGFFTVCLLVWSIRVQLYELSETRKEVKNSAIALADQVNVSKREHNRKQLEDACAHYFDLIYILFDKQVFKLKDTSKAYSLREILQIPYSSESNALDHFRMLISELPHNERNPNDYVSAVAIKCQVQITMKRLLACIELLGTKYVGVNELKEYWISRSSDLFRNIIILGVFRHDELIELRQHIKNVDASMEFE